MLRAACFFWALRVGFWLCRLDERTNRVGFSGATIVRILRRLSCVGAFRRTNGSKTICAQLSAKKKTRVIPIGRSLKATTRIDRSMDRPIDRPTDRSNSFADQAQAETELGVIANEHMTRGEMMPSEVVLSLVIKRLEQRDCVQNGWILDGKKQQQQSLVYGRASLKKATKAMADSGRNVGLRASICLDPTKFSLKVI